MQNTKRQRAATGTQAAKASTKTTTARAPKSATRSGANAAPKSTPKASAKAASRAAAKAARAGTKKAKDRGFPAAAVPTGPDPVGTDLVVPRPPKLQAAVYERELARLQRELVKMQEWVVHEGLKVCVLFEGRDAAGKGGTIKRIVDRTNPRVLRVVALGTPTEKERTQWYFQRYVEHLPAAGEIVLFDRSWYNRAGVEHVMGFCTHDEYVEFLRATPEFERMLLRSGIILVKYWFSVSDEEQERRFRERIRNPDKRWKLSAMDLESRARWVDYSRAKDAMFTHTDTKWSPWWVVNADDKRRARLNCISHLLSQVPYTDLTSRKLALPDRQDDDYVRPPVYEQTFVPERY